MRGERLYAAIRSAFSAASHGGFRLLQYSVQSNHVHLLVEADGRSKLARGVQGLAIRVAKAVNRALRRRGKVWSDRYHARALPTPREFRNGLVYVLQNWRKHVPGAHGFDPRSSARWFSGWRTPIPVMQGPAPVAEPRTWLARIGWRLHGLVDAREAPSRVL